MAEVDSYPFGSNLQVGPSHMTSIEEPLNIEGAKNKGRTLKRLTKRREESGLEDGNEPYPRVEEDPEEAIELNKEDDDEYVEPSNNNKQKKERKPRKPRQPKTETSGDPDKDFINDKNNENGEKPKKEKAKKTLNKNKENLKQNTDDLLEKLKNQPGFIIEEEDEEENGDSQRIDYDNSTSKRTITMKGEFKAPNGLALDRKKSSSLNPNIIKTKNKFFNEIDTMGNLHNEEDHGNEALVLDSAVEGETEIFVQERSKKKKDLSSFLQKLNKFREDRAIVNNSSNDYQKNNTINLKLTQSENLENHEEKSDIPHSFSQPLIHLVNSDELAESQTNFSNVENSANINKEEDQVTISNSEETGNTLSKKVSEGSAIIFKKEDFNGLLKRNFSTNVEDLTERDFHLEVEITGLSRQVKNDPTSSALFLNKLSRSTSMLERAILKTYDKTIQIHDSRHSGKTPTKKGERTTRAGFKEKIWDDIQKKKSKNLSFEEIQMRFKQTSFEDLNLEHKKIKKDDSKNEEGKEPKNQEKEKIFDKEREEINKQIEELENEEQRLQESEEESLVLSGEDEEQEEEQDGEADEENGENDEEGENEEANNQGDAEQMEKAGNEREHNETGGAEFANGPSEGTLLREVTSDQQKQPEGENDMIIEHNFPSEGTDELAKRSRIFKKLKKVATEALERKQKEIEDRKRQEKRAELKRKKKELFQNLANRVFFDKEAEEGSDNEEHDDIIKDINRKEEEDEERKMGDDLDKDLQGLIDDNVDINEDDENDLWMKFQNDWMRKDKEELKRVINKAYNMRKRGINDEELFQDETRRKKLKMIEERLKYLEQQEDSYVEKEVEEKEREEKDSLFEDDEEEALKAQEFNRNLKKEISKIKLMKKPEELKVIEAKLSLGDDESISTLNKINLTLNHPLSLKYSNSTGAINHVGVIKKNSVLGAKHSNHNISLFNSNFNRDVINDYGFKTNIFENRAAAIMNNIRQNTGLARRDTSSVNENKVSSGNQVLKSTSFMGKDKGKSNNVNSLKTPTKGSSLNKLLGNNKQNDLVFRPSPYKGLYFQKK